MIQSYVRHSPSALNLFAASPSMFVLEKVLGHRQPANAPMYRGIAVEDGVTTGLLNPDATIDKCISVALQKYLVITALSSDRRRDDYAETIPAMVEAALKELRPYGIPSHIQGFVEWKPEGLALPIVGYFDYHWETDNVTTDLKTTEKMPSQVKHAHARQVALYVTSNNAKALATYVTPKKCITYGIENIDAHRAALVELAKRVEAFLSLSDDPEFFKTITAPDIESFYWSGPPARQLAFEHWRI